MKYRVQTFGSRRDPNSTRQEGGMATSRRIAEQRALLAVTSGRRRAALVMREDGRTVAYYDEHDLP